MRAPAASIVALLLAALAGCQKETTTPPPAREKTAPPAPVSADAPLRVRESMLVSTQWLADHLKDDKLVILHVAKSREGYDKAHIPGARFLAWSDLAVTRDGVLNEIPAVDVLTATARRLGIDADSRIVLYDEEDAIPAARAYFVMDYLGLGDQTALLDGQFKTWQAEDRPTTAEAPEVTATEWKPKKTHPEIIATLEEMRGLSSAATQPDGQGACMIDARPISNYTGEVPGNGVPRGGHIPGAANVFSGQNVVSDDKPLFRSPEQLREMYAKQGGVKPGEAVVTYCRTGGQASLAYFVTKYLGYDARMYDGSFSQWSSQQDTPVTAGDKRM